mmetsp:Transcript_1286/g.3898  ORF Transcript_1286/g.3898 Transcript_1286/m.3898 type:complete len:266 (+) Transcript_1286:219-1016(+)
MSEFESDRLVTRSEAVGVVGVALERVFGDGLQTASCPLELSRRVANSLDVCDRLRRDGVVGLLVDELGKQGDNGLGGARRVELGRLVRFDDVERVSAESSGKFGRRIFDRCLHRDDLLGHVGRNDCEVGAFYDGPLQRDAIAAGCAHDEGDAVSSVQFGIGDGSRWHRIVDGDESLARFVAGRDHFRHRLFGLLGPSRHERDRRRGNLNRGPFDACQRVLGERHAATQASGGHLLAHVPGEAIHHDDDLARGQLLGAARVANDGA